MDLEEKITATTVLIEGWKAGDVTDDEMLAAIKFFDDLSDEQKKLVPATFKSRLDLTASMASMRRKKSKPIHPFTAVDGRTLSDEETEKLVSDLAGLSPATYDQQRASAAAQLRMRLPTLDAMVKAVRDRKPAEDKAALAPRMPHPTAVVGSDLLRDLISDLTRYVSIEPNYAAATSFWALHTYLVGQSFITPRLAITAPQPRCGKTTLVNWLRTVVQRPLNTVNVSAAAVFHVVEDLQPTLLIDEADTFLGADDGLRGILNSGHQKDGVVYRWDAKARCPRLYSTFCACAISLIGNLPSTLQDRSVRIRLRRRTPDEKISSLRGDKVDDELARRCARWAADNAAFVENADPAIPAQLFNRVEDNWRPLLALADVVGGEWPERLRQIAIAVAELEAGEDPSADTQLLRDIRDIFGDRDWITTNYLLMQLQLGEHAGLSGKRLANKLKPYGVAPRQERRGDRVERGYFAKDFADAFARYLGVPDVPDVPDADDDLEDKESIQRAG